MSDIKQQDVFSDSKRASMPPPPIGAPSGAPPPLAPGQSSAQRQYAAPAGPPPAYIKDVSMADTSTYNTDAALLALCRAKGISPYFATQITRLREYSSIRLVLDDSGSMKSMLNIYGAAPTTRWQLLQTMVREIFDLMAIARGGDREPVSVHLLNMLPQGMKCESVGQLQEFFQSGPTGTTPTLEVMRDIMTPEHMVYEEGVLTLLITDGAPNCGHQAFRNFLLDAQRRYPASYITVGLCTDVS